ncbi:hypothetical protein NE237_016092 [Protea cynaroides]|uniref:Uncharacterized protein n=1 Tax=Protea cynaroides TaxID=273540 RepID=A0A9Q0KFI2_9MAGN|nr:hypothetical protein NE237_016092 [Protea cynaroides]
MLDEALIGCNGGGSVDRRRRVAKGVEGLTIRRLREALNLNCSNDLEGRVNPTLGFLILPLGLCLSQALWWINVSVWWRQQRIDAGVDPRRPTDKDRGFMATHEKDGRSHGWTDSEPVSRTRSYAAVVQHSSTSRSETWQTQQWSNQCGGTTAAGITKVAIP